MNYNKLAKQLNEQDELIDLYTNEQEEMMGPVNPLDRVDESIVSFIKRMES